jgi:hypothetical protein
MFPSAVRVRDSRLEQASNCPELSRVMNKAETGVRGIETVLLSSKLGTGRKSIPLKQGFCAATNEILSQKHELRLQQHSWQPTLHEQGIVEYLVAAFLQRLIHPERVENPTQIICIITTTQVTYLRI